MNTTNEVIKKQQETIENLEKKLSLMRQSLNLYRRLEFKKATRIENLQNELNLYKRVEKARNKQIIALLKEANK